MSCSLQPRDAAGILRQLNITPSAPNITELTTLYKDVGGDIEAAKRIIQRTTFVLLQEIRKRDEVSKGNENKLINIMDYVIRKSEVSPAETGATDNAAANETAAKAPAGQKAHVTGADGVVVNCPTGERVDSVNDVATTKPTNDDAAVNEAATKSAVFDGNGAKYNKIAVKMNEATAKTDGRAAVNKPINWEDIASNVTKLAVLETNDVTRNAITVKMADDENEAPGEDFGPKVDTVDASDVAMNSPTNDDPPTKAVATDANYIAAKKLTEDEASTNEADMKMNGVKQKGVVAKKLKMKRREGKMMVNDDSEVTEKAPMTNDVKMAEMKEAIKNTTTLKVDEPSDTTESILSAINSDSPSSPLDLEEPPSPKRSKKTCIHQSRLPSKSVSPPTHVRKDRSPRKSVSPPEHVRNDRSPPKHVREETRKCRFRSPRKHDDCKETRNYRSKSPRKREYHEETRNYRARSSSKRDNRDEIRDYRYYQDRRESRRYYDYY